VNENSKMYIHPRQECSIVANERSDAYS